MSRRLALTIPSLVFLGLIPGSAGSLSAQTDPDGEPVLMGRTYQIPSTAFGEERPVTVALPPDYDPSGAYPVLYVLNGSTALVYTVGAAQVLSSSDRMPPSIVVGVVPTADWVANMSPLAPGEPAPGPGVGTADDLKAFLRDELRPWIEARYPTLPLNVLLGASQAGLFVTHVLNTEPDLFEGYVSISPTLGYDEGRFVASMDDLFERFPAPRGRFYMTSGHEGGPMLAGAWRLAATLERHAPPSFDWSWKHLPEETHPSMLGRGTYDALEWIFGDWNPQALWTELRHRGAVVLPRIQAHYARLSQEVGFQVDVPVARIREIVVSLARAGRVEPTIEIAEALVDLAPGDSMSHLALGEALHLTCRLPEARRRYEDGIRLATEERRPLRILRSLRDTMAELDDEIRRGACEAPGDGPR